MDRMVQEEQLEVSHDGALSGGHLGLWTKQQFHLNTVKTTTASFT